MSLGGQPADNPLSPRSVVQGAYAQLAQATTYTLTAGGVTALSGASVSVSPTGRSNGTAYVSIYVAASCQPNSIGAGWTQFYGGVQVDGGAQYQLFSVWSNGWENMGMQGMIPLGVTPGSHTFQVYMGANSPYSQYLCKSFVIGVWEI